jgi:hypothetical protein
MCGSQVIRSKRARTKTTGEKQPRGLGAPRGCVRREQNAANKTIRPGSGGPQTIKRRNVFSPNKEALNGCQVPKN